MDLFVIRHAIAVDRNLGGPDAQRPLTDLGRERFVQAVRGLDRLGVRLDLALSSPWLRAAQTAELLGPLMEGPVKSSEELARDPSASLIELLEGSGEERTAVVGHEPWLSELVAWLITGDAGLGYAFPLKKGGVAHLEGHPVPGAMRLMNFWRPRTLRHLGLSP